MDFVQVVQKVVVEPDLFGAAALFWTSLINELFAALPYIILLSSQFPFIEDPFSLPTLVKLSLFVLIPVSFGASVGSLLLYGLSYFGGKPAIEKFGKYVRLSWEDVEKVKARFRGSWYDEIIFLLLRSIPFLPSLPINVTAGVMQMRFAPYFVLTVAGTIIKIAIAFVFIAIGAEGLEEFAQ